MFLREHFLNLITNTVPHGILRSVLTGVTKGHLNLHARRIMCWIGLEAT